MQLYGGFSLSYYCRLFGKSRQAWYGQKTQSPMHMRDALVIKLVKEIREQLPYCGVDKLYHMLRLSFENHGIKLGRDGLYKLMGNYGMLMRHPRRKPYCTFSNHHYRKYPNLIREKIINAPGNLWVSDITYIRQASGFSYLSIVTDAYSRKIVGYKLHPTLHSEGAVDALLMAAKDIKRTTGLIHHSDRGIQYCCNEYVQIINHLNIQLSMTEKGDPYENAIAERINGILKYEHGLKETFTSFEHAKKAVDDAITKYNNIRIHDSCGRLTPMAAHEKNGTLKKYWRKKNYKTSNKENNQVEVP